MFAENNNSGEKRINDCLDIRNFSYKEPNATSGQRYNSEVLLTENIDYRGVQKEGK